MDEGWKEVRPEDMSAAAELLAEEMQVIKAAMQVQASILAPLASITTTLQYSVVYSELFPSTLKVCSEPPLLPIHGL